MGSGGRLIELLRRALLHCRSSRTQRKLAACHAVNAPRPPHPPRAPPPSPEDLPDGSLLEAVYVLGKLRERHHILDVSELHKRKGARKDFRCGRGGGGV